MDPNQNVSSAPEQGLSIPQPPAPPVQNTPGSEAQIVNPKKRNLPKILLIITVLLLALAGAIYVLFSRQRQQSSETESNPYTEHVFEEFPDFPGIPIGENTVSFVKADGKFCLLYKGVVYLPQDSGSLIPKREEATEEMLAFPWIGLVDAPADLPSSKTGEVFSFKASPSNNSFVFIMRWLGSEDERYHMYRFFNNNLSELRIFTQADGLFYAPKLSLFSLGGNFLNLSMFRCADCLTEQPESLLYYIPTGDIRNIGKVSFFEWSQDDNVYSYKEYKEGTGPAKLPLRTNEFFEQSEELLTPT